MYKVCQTVLGDPYRGSHLHIRWKFLHCYRDPEGGPALGVVPRCAICLFQRQWRQAPRFGALIVAMVMLLTIGAGW
ncbi:hypothetical protein GCM10018965_042980 [Nonomuraea roseola]